MSTNNPKSKAVSLFLLLLVVILGSVLTYISVTSKSKIVSNNAGTEGIAEDVTKDWKTYANTFFNYELKYPEKFTPVNIADGASGSALPNSHVVAFIDKETPPVGSITIQVFQPRPTYPTTLIKSQGVFGNLSYEKYSRTKSDTYLFVSEDKKRYVEILVDYNPNIDYKDVFDQILSTFRFVPVATKVQGQTDLIVPRAKSDTEEVSTKATKYSFFYTPSFVKTINSTADVYYIDFTLSSGANLSISIPFIGEANMFDKKPTIKIIDNSNFKDKIYRIKDNDSENTYRYVTGYSEDPNICGFDDDSYFACADGDALLGEGENGGAFSISCIASSATSLKGCDDFIKDLDIKVSDINL